tara:strand:+ start:428 stop:2668 length:2241 start_codon:yes stop_codon:yes gene_type:complete
MAEEVPETPEIQTKVVSAPLDDIANVIHEKFEDAKEYRRDHEQHWQEAYDAYRAKYPSHISKANELANERGIFVNQTRRKVNSAKIKIGTLLFEDGKIPFSITPSRRPRYFPPDIEAPPDRPDLFEDAIRGRAEAMEERIRDLLDRTSYNTEVQHAIHEMALYGSGVTKGITLENKNFPVFESVQTPDNYMEVETRLEEELVPTVRYLSIWNVFPSPEAAGPEDADYIIQRSFLSPIQLRELAKKEQGFIPGTIEEVIENNIGETSGWDQSDHPRKSEESSGNRVKRIEVLEFWGRLDGKDLEGHLPIDAADMPDSMDVVVTCIGDKVVKMAQNPFDGTKPFHFCYWQKNPESIWGDGIYYAIRDSQAILNFCYAMMIEGKSLSAAPLTVIDPNSFEPGTDTEQVYPGKQFRVKPGASVRDAFQSVVIPDVTNGLLQIVQQLEREADLDSGQTAIGYGDMSPSQTKTATGMSILNSNANRQTADVVRSVSYMITKNIQAIYRWLMVDSPDNSIKGDYEAISTGYEQYVAKEVHNTQLINFLQVAGQLPQFGSYIKNEAFARPLLRAFNLDPEKMLKTEEQVLQEQQAAQQAQQQAIQQQAQMQAQMVQMQEQAKAQGEAMVEKEKALLDEKQQVSEDQRKLEMQERLELIRQGNVLNPTDLQGTSMLLREEQFDAQQQVQQKQQQEEQQAIAAEDQRHNQARQETMGRMQQMAQKAQQRSQDRLQGGPSADDIMRQQQEENADIAA